MREYAAIVEVNANTTMRSFDYLQSQNIIYNKRGIGYFVSSGAKELMPFSSSGCFFERRGKLLLSSACYIEYLGRRIVGYVSRIYSQE